MRNNILLFQVLLNIFDVLWLFKGQFFWFSVQMDIDKNVLQFEFTWNTAIKNAWLECYENLHIIVPEYEYNEDENIIHTCNTDFEKKKIIINEHPNL